jgi:hypothetical protein
MNIGILGIWIMAVLVTKFFIHTYRTGEQIGFSDDELILFIIGYGLAIMKYLL